MPRLQMMKISTSDQCLNETPQLCTIERLSRVLFVSAPGMFICVMHKYDKMAYQMFSISVYIRYYFIGPWGSVGIFDTLP